MNSGNPALQACSSCGASTENAARYCTHCGASLVDGQRAGRRRVVVTGLGAITGLGPTALESWRSLLANGSAIHIDQELLAQGYTCAVRGDVDAESVPNRFLDAKTLRNTSLFSYWLVEATGEALIDASLLDHNFEPTADLLPGGSVVGSCVGGIYNDLLPQYDVFTERGPSRLSPHLHVKFPLNMASYTVQWRFGLGGPSNTVTTACATGTQAIGEAYHAVAFGHAPLMVAGASESTIHPMGTAGFAAMRALVTDSNDSPDTALRPFDKTRAGFALGEGAGVLILEDLEHARARGAHVYAEILGFASTNDAYHPIAPHPEGEGAARAVFAALRDADVDPEDIGHVQAHAASTPAGDRAEGNAITQVYGQRASSIPVMSVKGAIGHCMGGAGGIETVMGIYSIADQVIPPTRNYRNPDPEIQLDIVTGEARPHTFNVMAKHGFGLGGQNACVIIGRPPESIEHRRSALAASSD